MNDVPTISSFAEHEWALYRDLRLRALGEAPDAFGSTFALEVTRSDAEWAVRLGNAMDARQQMPLVARLGSVAIGLAWVRIQESDASVAHLYQVWVAPECRRHGAGKSLLDAAVDWARGIGARQIELDVTCGDTPAMRLYVRAGFKPIGVPSPLRTGSTVLKQSMRLALG